MRCAARVATRCADGQLDGGWVDGDAPGIGASNGIGPKVAAPHALFLALGGDEACNAWLHHVCLRTKGRMVFTHNHEIVGLRAASRGGGAALIPSSTTCYLHVTYKCVLDTHKAIIHLYPVIIGPGLPYLHTYQRVVQVGLVFWFFIMLPLDARDICHWELPCQEWRLPQICCHNVSELRPRRRAARIGPNLNPSA